jgi:hypothetical protein
LEVCGELVIAHGDVDVLNIDTVQALAATEAVRTAMNRSLVESDTLDRGEDIGIERAELVGLCRSLLAVGMPRKGRR